MSKLPINLTRLVVEEELETLAEQEAFPREFSNPHIQYTLIDEVLCQIPNRYILLDTDRQDSLPSLLSCVSTCARLKIEELLKRGIHNRLTEPRVWQDRSTVEETWNLPQTSLVCTN
ncbi:MAG: hypothetical protein WBB29_00520 [Geitlerinemataceae cyanobacterium]